MCFIVLTYLIATVGSKANKTSRKQLGRFSQGNYAQALLLLEKMVELEESPHHHLGLMLKSACLEKNGEEGEAKAIQTFLNVDSASLIQKIEEGFSKPLY